MSEIGAIGSMGDQDADKKIPNLGAHMLLDTLKGVQTESVDFQIKAVEEVKSSFPNMTAQCNQCIESLQNGGSIESLIEKVSSSSGIN